MMAGSEHEELGRTMAAEFKPMSRTGGEAAEPRGQNSHRVRSAKMLHTEPHGLCIAQDQPQGTSAHRPQHRETAEQ